MGMSSSRRIARRGGTVERTSDPANERACIGPHQLAWLAELLRDARASARLSNWESAFLDSIEPSFRRFGEQLLISDRQLATLRQIEEKIHAAG